MSADFFELEAPAPLEMFRARVIDDENARILAEWEKTRPLPPEEVKRIRARVVQLRKHLAAGSYDALKSRYQELREELSNLKIDLHNEPDRADELNQQIEAVKQVGRKIRAQMRPMMKQAALLSRLESRLGSHRAAVANDKLETKLRRDMESEMRIFARLIQDAYTRMQYCHRYSKDGKEIVDKIKIERCVITPDELQFKIRVSSRTLLGATINHLPYGVYAAQLITSESLNELTIATQRHVYSPQNEDSDLRNGVWIVVERLGLVDGLPKLIEIPPVWARYPHDQRHLIPLPMGVRRGRKINWAYLRHQPHVRINGQTGTGKTNLFNVILTSIFTHNTPDEIRLVLVDLKEGAAFGRFENLPHVEGAVITEVAEFASVLEQLEALRKARMYEIRKIADDIDAYNAVVAPERRLPRVAVIIDEYQAIYGADAQSQHKINKIMMLIATKARAAGIHLIVGTQSPYTDVLPKHIKSQFTMALSGRQATLGASMSTVGNSEAHKLPDIKGRMLCDVGADLFPVQIPLVTSAQIAEAVSKANNHPRPTPLLSPPPEDSEPQQAVELTPEERIIALALDKYGGDLKARIIWKENIGLSHAKTTQVIASIAEQGQLLFRGQCYDVRRTEGNFYRLVPADTQLHDEKHAQLHVTDRVSAHVTEGVAS